MKTAFSIAASAVLLISTSPCFALGSVLQVSREEAKKMGMEVRSETAGPNQVRVALEFKVEGGLKNFKCVDLWFGEGDNPLLAAPLQPDRSKPAGRGQLYRRPRPPGQDHPAGDGVGAGRHCLQTPDQGFC